MLPPYSVKNGKFQRDYTVLHFKRQYSSTYESVMGKLHWMIFFCMFRKLNISRTWNNAKRQCPHCSYSQWGVQLRPKGTYTATVIFFFSPTWILLLYFTETKNLAFRHLHVYVLQVTGTMANQFNTIHLQSIKDFCYRNMQFYLLHKTVKEECDLKKGNIYLANWSPYGVNSKDRPGRQWVAIIIT